MKERKDNSIMNREAEQKEDLESYLVVDDITKKYGKTLAVENVAFSVGQGEMVTLLGPSGCGKSTILRCVAGLEKINAGQIIIDGDRVSSATENIFVPAEKRDVGMVFQSYAVWPHMSVWGNVAYPLQVHKVAKKEIASRVEKMLSIVGLEEMADRNVTKLSGGQQQRVVLARALVQNPRLLLFDEPLSNLDARLRVSMRFEIRQLQQRVGISTLYVTHDQTEAMVLSDRVIVMNQGHIEQVGPPLEIYRKPVSAFVASFFGEVNFIEGEIAPFNESSDLVNVEVELDKKKQVLLAQPQKGMKAGNSVYVCIRPQDVGMDAQHRENEDIRTFRGKISQIVHMGSHVEYFIDLGGLELLCHRIHEIGKNVGEFVNVNLRPELCICVSRESS